MYPRLRTLFRVHSDRCGEMHDTNISAPNATSIYFAGATYAVGKGNVPSASPDRKSADLGRPRSFPIGVALIQYCNTNNVSNKIIWGAFVLTGELDSDAGLNGAKDPHAIQPLQIEAPPQ